MKQRKGRLTAVLIGILLLCLCACGGGGARRSTVTHVRCDAKHETLQIKATLSAADVKTYRHKTVYLMEIPAQNTVADITTLIPIAKANAGGTLSFSVPLKNGARTVLYSGFVLAVFEQTEGYVALGDVRYVENPEVLAANKTPYPSYSSLKGLSLVTTADAAALGVTHTVIRVPIEQYLLAETDKEAFSTAFDGNTYYFDSTALAALDHKVKNLTDAGIEVYLELTLDTAADELPAGLSFLAASDCEAPAGEDIHYALSIDSGAAYQNLAAFLELLATRYTRPDGRYGFAGAFILGHGVNSLVDTNVDQNRTLREAASSYGRLLRLASTVLRAQYAEGKVFASLDNVWTVSDSETIGEEQLTADTAETTVDTGVAPMPKSRRARFGGREYLVALATSVSEMGDFPYGIALMPNASDGGSAIWKDAGAENRPETAYLTMKNLAVAGDLLDSDLLQYEGERRDLLLYHVMIASENEAEMATSYAYAYYQAVAADAVAFIYNGQWDRATGNTESGLWETDVTGEAIRRRAIYDIFRTIDVRGTDGSAYGAAAGAEWTSLYKTYKKAVQTAQVGAGSGETTEPAGIKKYTKTLLYDFSGADSLGFYPSDSARYLEMTDGALFAALVPRFAGDQMGVRSAAIPFDSLKNVGRIEVKLKTETADRNTSHVTLALSQIGAAGRTFYTSDVTLQSGNIQTVYFDVSKAGLKASRGDVRLSLWVEAETNGISPASYIEYAVSLYQISCLTKKSHAWLVILLVLLALLAAGGYAFYRFGGIHRFGGAARRRAAVGRGAPARRPVPGRGQAPGRPMPGGAAAPRANGTRAGYRGQPPHRPGGKTQ